MKFYRVKPEYDQTYKNPHVHDCDILIANELYNEKERSKMKYVSDRCFDVVDVPKNETYFCFGARFQDKNREELELC